MAYWINLAFLSNGHFCSASESSFAEQPSEPVLCIMMCFQRLGHGDIKVVHVSDLFWSRHSRFWSWEGTGAGIRAIKSRRGPSASIIVIGCKGRRARHSSKHVTLGLCPAHRLSSQNHPFQEVTAQQWLLCKLCHAVIIKGMLLRRLRLTPHSFFLPMPCLIVHKLNPRLL